MRSTSDRSSTTTETFDPVLASQGISPEFGAGVSLIYEALNTDGALRAVDKALFMAASGATRLLPQLTETQMRRARQLGLTHESATGAAKVMLLSSGEGAFQIFLDAMDAVFGRSDTPEPVDEPIGSSTAEALEYFQDHFGEVPVRQRLFSELVPQAFRGYSLMHRHALKNNTLAPKTVELLLCAITAAMYQSQFVKIHFEGARIHGATQQEGAEAILSAVPAAGVAAWAGSAAALDPSD